MYGSACSVPRRVVLLDESWRDVSDGQHALGAEGLESLVITEGTVACAGVKFRWVL